MNTLPKDHRSFAAAVTAMFPELDLAGVTIRTITRPGAADATLVYMPSLMDPSDLERLVLAPIARGLPDLPSAHLARLGCFPAPEQRIAETAQTLQEGLLAGLAGIHIDGHGQVLLLGSGKAEQPAATFGPDLGANVAILRRHLPLPALRCEVITGPEGRRCALVYLQGRASAETLAAMRRWITAQAQGQQKAAWWNTASGWLRLPAAMDTDSPPEAAAALRLGYAAVLDDFLPGARLGPLTLDLLLSAPGDQALAPPLHRLVRWPRLVAAVAGLVLSAFFVASASYHHAVIPGPFLVALASSRQNPALPVVAEILLVELLGDAIRTRTQRLGGRYLVLLSFIGTVLAITIAVQAGLLGAVSGVVGIASATLVQVFPNRTLRRAVRVWRYLFIGAAAGLGIYGVSLLWFMMVVYLQEEASFGHPIRRPLEVRSS